MTLRSALLALTLCTSAQAQIVIDGPLAHDRTARPGDRYTETVRVVNGGETAQEVRLYFSDYSFDASGANHFTEPGSSARSNVPWVGFVPPSIVVPPRSEIPVTFEVSVPAQLDGQAPAGSYWSLLMVEGTGAPLRDAEPGAPMQIQERLRYGIQIATHLPDDVGRIEIERAGVVRDEAGRPTLEVDIVNRGGLMVDGTAYVDVFSATGEARGRIDGSGARVYPGTSFRHRVLLDTLPAGTYEVLFVLDGGEGATFGAQFTLDL